MNLDIGFGGLVVLILLLVLRLPIAIAMGVVSLGGISLMYGERTALGILTSGPYEFTASWALSSIPMFVFMGYICYYAGITDRLFRAVDRAFRRFNGGLGVATIGGAAAFSAVSGSSLATAAAMGRIAIPEMTKNGYNAGFAGAIVAAGGTLGTMIPPSIIMIIYGIFTETSIGKLFIAGIIPGILSAIMYALTIRFRIKMNPGLVTARDRTDDDAVVEDGAPTSVLGSLLDVWPIIVLFVSIMGGLFAGLFSASEAGSVGAFIALIIAASGKKFDFAAFGNAVIATLQTTASIFLIGIGAVLFTRFLALSGVSDFMASYIIDVAGDPVLFIIGISILYLILGMFIDPIGIMLLTLPLLYPILLNMHVDLIWMGIIVVKLLELGLITPPVGMNLFVIKATMPDTPLEKIVRQVVWFVMADIVMLAILIAFPSISTFLPALVK
ncbi:TRAP transporter large permease [Oricola nitratireducens]|uniref:TRAP transporter large permease n=1 Tax=Oricola nitratireducens TaxID=2775868 RepID=UPI00186910A5|nr:TRAP transporter large permease [Oricola nitratireducens]